MSHIYKKILMSMNQLELIELLCALYVNAKNVTAFHSFGVEHIQKEI